MAGTNWTVTANHSSYSQEHASSRTSIHKVLHAPLLPQLTVHSLKLGMEIPLSASLRPCRSFTQCLGHIVNHVCFIPSHTSPPRHFACDTLVLQGYHVAMVMYILSHLKSRPLGKLFTSLLPTAVLGHRTPKQMTEEMKLLSTLRLHFTCSVLVRPPYSVFHKGQTNECLSVEMCDRPFLSEGNQINHCGLLLRST